MLGYNDKFSVSFINMRNYMGDILPITSDDVCFKTSQLEAEESQSLASVDVYEHQEHNNVPNCYCAFRILVGEAMTLREAIAKESFHLSIPAPIDLKLDDLVCCRNVDGQMYIFAQILPGDIVVRNVKELRDTIMIIDSDVMSFNLGAKRVRSRSYIATQEG